MNYRAYFFTNMYMGGIHAGIQAQHCTSELFVKCLEEELESEASILRKWAIEDKTTIILNGGSQKNLQEILELVAERVEGKKLHYFPYACFHESEEALNGALTSVGIILPDYIYDMDKIYPFLLESSYNSWAVRMHKKLKSCSLMR